MVDLDVLDIYVHHVFPAFGPTVDDNLEAGHVIISAMLQKLPEFHVSLTILFSWSISTDDMYTSGSWK
jgi:hypothetical protein